MRAVSSGLLRAVVLSLLLGLVTYLMATVALDAWHRSQDVDTAGEARLPEVLYNAPESVATTEQRGPVGPVAAAFAGTRVLDGLVGDVDRPWIAVSSRTGAYRAVNGPDLPPAGRGRVVVSPTGDRLTWATGDAVVVHNTLTGRNRVVPVPAATAVGAFSPDGRRLLVLASGELRVLDVGTGREVSSLGAVPSGAVPQAVWLPDGTAVSLVDDGLVEIDARTGRRTFPDVPLAAGAQLAWSPAGTRLVSLQEISGARRLQVWARDAAGTYGPAGNAPAEGIALGELLGFIGEQSVAVSGLSLETGALTRLFEVSVEGSSAPVEIGRLPGPGTNWVGPRTLEVASEALRGGTHDFGEPRWPWSHRAKLVSGFVLSLFALGMYLTRRPRARRVRPVRGLQV